MLQSIVALPTHYSPVVVLHASEQHVQLLVGETRLGVEESEALFGDLALVRRRLRVAAQASANARTRRVCTWTNTMSASTGKTLTICSLMWLARKGPSTED